MSIGHRIIPPAQGYTTLTINEVNIQEPQVRRGKMTNKGNEPAKTIQRSKANSSVH